MNVVVVTWHDAHADRSGGWVHVDTMDSDPYVVTTAGWLIKPAPKDKHVSIAQSLGDDSAMDHVIHIPVDMIQELKIWDHPPTTAIP